MPIACNQEKLFIKFDRVKLPCFICTVVGDVEPAGGGRKKILRRGKTYAVTWKRRTLFNPAGRCTVHSSAVGELGGARVYRP